MSDNSHHNLDLIFQGMDFLDLGVSIFNQQLHLVVANTKFVGILGFPETFGNPGTPLEEIFRFNAERGEYGPGKVEDLVRERIELAKRFEPHKFRRKRLDGTVIEIAGNPLPSGGFISTYRDVTHDEDLSIRLAEELRTAHDLQNRLFPTDGYLDRIREDNGLIVNALCRQAEEIGGDVWGLRKIEEGRVAFFVADTVGHGVVASLNAFRIHTIIMQYLDDWRSVADWACRVNYQLSEILEIGHYATFIFGVIDSRANTLEYVAGGYPPFLLGHIGPDPEPVLMDTSGLPLGVTDDLNPEVRKIKMPADWAVVLYSDALTETEIGINTFIGDDELRMIFSQGCSKGSHLHVFETFNDVIETWFPKGISDDLTLVCMGKARRPV